MEYKFYIDGNLVTSPNNWNEFEESLQRDEEKRHVFFDYPLSLEFTGTGYTALDNKYKESYNSLVELQITRETDTGSEVLIKTNIKMSNCTFDLTQEIVTCELDDLTYQSYIFNNYDVEVAATAETTKNGLTLDNPAPVLNITMFDPTDGSDTYVVQCVDVIDAVRATIQYISDNTIAFESTWYDNLPDDEKLAICVGRELRGASDNLIPITSLESLFENLWKKFNLYLIVESPITNPTLRIETESYLDESSSEIVLENLAFVQRGLDFERLYGTIDVGSTKYLRDYGSSFTLPYLQLLGFSEEKYNLSGVIGVDNTLDLVSTFIIDNNILQDVLVNANTEYFEDTFMFQYTASTLKATQSDYLENGSTLYNETLLNSNVLDRFSYLGNVILDTQANEDGFQAEKTSIDNFTGIVTASGVPLVSSSAWPFNDDSTDPNYDAGNNYDNTTYTYTVPTAGVYRFQYRQPFVQVANTSEEARISGSAQFVKNGNPLTMPENIRWENPNGFVQNIETILWQLQAKVLQNFGENYTFILEQTIVCEAGDEIKVAIDFDVRKFGLTPEVIGVNVVQGTFKTVETALSGGIIDDKDPEDYFIGLYEVDNVMLTQAQWDKIRLDPTTKIKFSVKPGEYRYAIVKEISRNLETQSTELKLLFNRNQSFI